MIGRILMLTALAWACDPSPTHAGLITYTESVVTTGTLGGQGFSNVLVTLALTVDTSGITESGGIFYTSAARATVDIAGVGHATFTDNIDFFNFPGIEAGFEDRATTSGGAVILTIVNNTALSAYDLGSAIGPITGPASGGGGDFATNLGVLYLDPSGTSGGTFTATFASVPEPASLAMTALGVSAVLGFVRLRQSHFLRSA